MIIIITSVLDRIKQYSNTDYLQWKSLKIIFVFETKTFVWRLAFDKLQLKRQRNKHCSYDELLPLAVPKNSLNRWGTSKIKIYNVVAHLRWLCFSKCTRINGSKPECPGATMVVSTENGNNFQFFQQHYHDRKIRNSYDPTRSIRTTRVK